MTERHYTSVLLHASSPISHTVGSSLSHYFSMNSTFWSPFFLWRYLPFMRPLLRRKEVPRVLFADLFYLNILYKLHPWNIMQHEGDNGIEFEIINKIKVIRLWINANLIGPPTLFAKCHMYFRYLFYLKL